MPDNESPRTEKPPGPGKASTGAQTSGRRGEVQKPSDSPRRSPPIVPRVFWIPLLRLLHLRQ
eukprot:1974346-Pyramimonas_sp.AAC.1